MDTNNVSNLNPLSEELNAASEELDARKLALLKDGVQIVLDEIQDSVEPLNLDFETLKIRQQDLINLSAKTIAKTVGTTSLASNRQDLSYLGVHWHVLGGNQGSADLLRLHWVLLLEDGSQRRYC